VAVWEQKNPARGSPSKWQKP